MYVLFFSFNFIFHFPRKKPPSSPHSPLDARFSRSCAKLFLTRTQPHDGHVLRSIYFIYALLLFFFFPDFIPSLLHTRTHTFINIYVQRVSRVDLMGGKKKKSPGTYTPRVRVIYTRCRARARARFSRLPRAIIVENTTRPPRQLIFYWRQIEKKKYWFYSKFRLGFSRYWDERKMLPLQDGFQGKLDGTRTKHIILKKNHV